jgi:hypothetical protein
VSPATRVSRPRAMVSTSGSSGTLSGYKIGAAGCADGQPRAAVATRSFAEIRFAPPPPDSVC